MAVDGFRYNASLDLEVSAGLIKDKLIRSRSNRPMQLFRVYVDPGQTMPVRGEPGGLLTIETSVAAKVGTCRLDFQAWLFDQ
ncbi:hypothetical protein CRX57_02340 [Pseudomonas putida]|uniref:Uncharacterized protein n=1 Tax=Pseudomonas putida TaxID=303 RepID=A0A2C5W4R4_PSEPU|nr:hypothetical protein CRX57_02340 [Pseudomonas putida]